MMDGDGRFRSSHHRGTGSRRGTESRPERPTGIFPSDSSKRQGHYSSSEEETDDKIQTKGFLSPLKTGERGVNSGRARVSPLDLNVTQSGMDGGSAASPLYEKGLPGGLITSESQQQRRVKGLLYNQDASRSVVPQQYYSDYQRSTGNEYESPMLKGKQKGAASFGRRLGKLSAPHGSSLSSSDNNSDTTYAESDINNSLHVRIASLDPGEGTPPDPAPPEVPPRGPSHHHPLLAAQRSGVVPHSSDGQESLYHDGGGGDGGVYQQPGGGMNVFLSQEYLMSGANPRYIGTVSRKSPSGHPIFGSSPMREGMPSDFSQPTHLITTFGSQKELGALNCSSAAALAGHDARNTLNPRVGSRPSFSGRKLQLEKPWKERISWKCSTIVLLLLCAILIALLTFFAASYASLDSRCIVVEDPARVVAVADPPEKTTTEYPVPVYTIPVPKDSPDVAPDRPPERKREGGSSTPLVHALNRMYSKGVDPHSAWIVQIVVKQPGFIRFNLSVPRSAQLAFFGRRNVAPSITQYDFVKFISSGRRGRMRREAHTNVELASHLLTHWREVVGIYSNGVDDIESTDAQRGRSKRYLEQLVNVTIVEYLDTGKWYLSVYNDGLGINQIALIVEEAPELQSSCLNDCSGRGSCVLGQCECVDGWIGEDCSKSVCPVLCSGHGSYGGGMCHCESDWKGQECDIPLEECQVPDCNKHGSCRGGTCICAPGWKGVHCEEVDCKDPHCGHHGMCIDGGCLCHAGWTGENCSLVDEKVFACLPSCSGNGRYDLRTSSCVCHDLWSGSDCSIARCSLDCVHGECNDGGVCVCEDGWTGSLCSERTCDSRCSHHGQCHNGTCLCVQGWNGKHCTIPGCVNSCSGNGICTTEEGLYRCSCSPGWTGDDCSVAIETQCDDDKDNDGDGLVDCSDSECCTTVSCRDHVMCMVSADPVEVLLRKQPPAVTASFYHKVKFIIEDRNVQSFARKDEFTERRVSVIRGRVVTTDGQGIVGVRTSIEKESKYGLTATRKDGWFDVLVNGGGAVTLQFQRAHFEPLTLTVPVLWNKIIVLEPITMFLKDKAVPSPSLDPETLWDTPCTKHDYAKMRPQVIPAYLPSSIGGASDSSVIFTEAQVVQESLLIPGSDLSLLYLSSSVSGYLSSLLLQLTPANVPKSLIMVHLKVVVEGTVFERVFEADPNINFTFSWNKRNVYKQKVFGEALAEVSVGYEYEGCDKIVWEVETAYLFGFHMDISNIGGWNLDIHHMYNFESGLLQRGDGSTLNLRNRPRLASTLIGTGKQRTVVCQHCSGLATDADLLTPTALATGPDGTVYVGDFNFVRRVDSEGIVSTILELSSSQVSHGYYLALSPVDGQVYVSDPSKYRVIRILSVTDVSDPTNNFETVAGNGERCIPGDDHHCGDKGPAKRSRLSHPKGLALSADRSLYIADGTNIRVVDPRGIIHTLIGHHGHKNRWKPFPCKSGIPSSQVELQWPTELALSPLDDTLHILDDHVVLQVTKGGVVRVRAGRALHCESSTDHDKKPPSSILSFAFSSLGSMFVAEETPKKDRVIRRVWPSGDRSEHFAGAFRDVCGCSSGQECSNCPQDKYLMSSNILFGRISSIAVSPDGVVHVADLDSVKVFSLKQYLPGDDHNGDYHVSFPDANEVYVFNRHGHHVETRDLTTGRTLYTFSYSKNTSFGRLSKVTDAAGNKVTFLRDYKSAVTQVESTAGRKFQVQLSRLGLMTSFVERSGRAYHFDYDGETGLLLSSTVPGSLTTVFEYDAAGRLKTLITPTGSRVAFDISLFPDANQFQKHLVVSSSESALFDRDNEKMQNYFNLAFANGEEVLFKHGEMVASLTLHSNGSFTQAYPWGGISSSSVTSSPNPLLESLLPTQARLFPLTTHRLLRASPENEPNRLVLSFGVVAAKSLRERLVEKVFLVNGTRVMSQRWRGSDMTNRITDGERGALFEVTHDSDGRPTRLNIGDSITSVGFSYDRFGRVDKCQWERSYEQYDYNSRGFLSAVKTQSGRTRFSFNSDFRLLESITLPSGRTWTYSYDTEGGLQSITTPSGSKHDFSVQVSLGFFVFSYTPPGANLSFRQHLDRGGRLRLTAYPGGYPKVLFGYNDAGQLHSVVSGGSETAFTYGSGGLPEQILHRDSDLDYKMDLVYLGHLLVEHQISFGPKTGLSGAKFTYDYDSNFRLSGMGGRVGGQNLRDVRYEYSAVTGKINRIGAFKISRPGFNETILHDGTAIISRRRDSQFLTTGYSVTIHKMEVFRMDYEHSYDGRLLRTNTYARNFRAKPYTTSKNFTYDPDGQLVAVAAKEPWSFSYDSFGNMLSLTYSTNTIPMEYDARDRIVKFGDGGYKYDQGGAIVQNVRGVTYRYDSRGLLTRASKAGRFNVAYSYDHERRLVSRKDNFGNVTQFIYADQTHPQKVSHIYNPRDGHLITLTYDEGGRMVFAQVYRNKYYIATDECGTPLMMFNQYGEVVREVMRSPYGHIIYDSNPYIYLPVDFCGGILDARTELVHMPGGRVYDPLIGLWLTPSWDDIQRNLMTPMRLSLYRFNGNDPVNVGARHWTTNDEMDWLRILGYDMSSLAPQLPEESGRIASILESFAGVPLNPFIANQSPFSSKVVKTRVVSGFALNRGRSFVASSRLAAVSPTKLRRDFSPYSHNLKLSATPGPFGRGIVVSMMESGHVVVSSTSAANSIFQDVFTSVFSNSYLLDHYSMAHGNYVFYFVKPDAWKASEDLTQLNRLAGEVNITVRDSPSAVDEDDNPQSGGGGGKMVDVRLRRAFASIHIRYGANPETEKRRLLKRAKKMTIRKAWADERARLAIGLPGTVDWTTGEVQRLLSGDSVPGYSARIQQPLDRYPELVDDPTNVHFVRVAKRTRRNSKGRRRSANSPYHSHRRRRRRGRQKGRWGEYSSSSLS